jgi:hypothetical protein
VLHQLQICWKIRHESNHAGLNFPPPAAQFSGRVNCAARHSAIGADFEGQVNAGKT